jgi:hypothetical protein
MLKRLGRVFIIESLGFCHSFVIRHSSFIFERAVMAAIAVRHRAQKTDAGIFTPAAGGFI